MLRKALLGFGALLVVAGTVAALASHSFAGLPPAAVGAVLVAAILLERRRYKRVEDRVPGPDWQPTGERFADPVSGVLVAVYHQPLTGKRAYVRIGAT